MIDTTPYQADSLGIVDRVYTKDSSIPVYEFSTEKCKPLYEAFLYNDNTTCMICNPSNGYKCAFEIATAQTMFYNESAIEDCKCHIDVEYIELTLGKQRLWLNTLNYNFVIWIEV